MEQKPWLPEIPSEQTYVWFQIPVYIYASPTPIPSTAPSPDFPGKG